MELRWIALFVIAVGGTAAADVPQQRARTLAAEGADYYKRGDLAVAAAMYRSAYALDPDPTYQYRLALALEGSGDPSGAAAAYRTYLDTASSVDDRAAIERRIQALQAMGGASTAAAPTTPFRPIGPPTALPPSIFKTESPGTPSVIPWLAVGAGVAMVGTGVVVRQTTDRSTLGNSLLIAGGVALIGGVIWEIRDRKRHRPLPPFVQLE